MYDEMEVNQIENEFYDDNQQDENDHADEDIPLSTNAIKMTNLCRNPQYRIQLMTYLTIGWLKKFRKCVRKKMRKKDFRRSEELRGP